LPVGRLVNEMASSSTELTTMPPPIVACIWLVMYIRLGDAEVTEGAPVL
jgi:hypothetical protein